jgi:signal transduction histidine kinase
MEKVDVDQTSVLIVSDEANFSGAISARWQSERNLPHLALLNGDLCPGFDGGGFEMAIVGAVRASVLPAVLTAVNPVAKPVIFVSDNPQTAEAVRSAQPRVLVLQQREGWLDALILITTEILRRNQALARAQRAEHENVVLESQAALGRYMLEMRHTLNNALTSVLGNSELLLLDAGALSPAARSQVDTIRNMALRMHEILQRFSSLEKEMSFVERQAEKDKSTQTRSAAAGF